MVTPRADIHRHLEGAIRPATAWALHRRDPPDADGDAYAAFAAERVVSEPRPLLEVLDRFALLRAPLREPADITRVAVQAVRDAVEEGVTHLELRFSPTTLARQVGTGLGAVFDAIRRADEQVSGALAALGWVVIVSRARGVEAAWEVARAAARHGRGLLCGADFAADEFRHRTAAFADVARALHGIGLPLTVHTGEGTGPDCVAEALALPGVRRLGHALSLVDDPDLVAEARERGIVVEACPTSNLRTRTVAAAEAHPARRLAQAGVPVVLATDDPALFDIDLAHEHRLARRAWGWTEDRCEAADHLAREAGFWRRVA